MHPIEHLRYLARTGDTDPEWVVPEAADALRGLCGDRNALVMAARMLLGHLATCGPLWWLCGHTLTASDPVVALDSLVEAQGRDATSLHLALALSDHEGAGPRVVSSTMVGSNGVVVERSGLGESFDSIGVWVVAGLGTLVPPRVFDTVTRDLPGTLEVVKRDRIDRIFRPSGVTGTAALSGPPDVAFVPELMARP